MIRVLANDGLQEGAIDRLKLAGIEVVNNHYDKDKLKEEIKKFDVLVVRSATKVTADILNEAQKGNLILQH